MASMLRRGPARIHANLTPMIDVTFLLIVFFVLVSQIVESESVEMRLPELAEPATVLPEDEERAVVNVLPGAGGAARGYRLGSREYPAGARGAERLAADIAARLQANPGLGVNLRADRATHYRFVQPALDAVREAGRLAGTDARVQLVVIPEEGS